VASALKWAVADFDDLGVDADRQTLSPEDFAKVMDLLKLGRCNSACFSRRYQAARTPP